MALLEGMPASVATTVPAPGRLLGAFTGAVRTRKVATRRRAPAMLAQAMESTAFFCRVAQTNATSVLLRGRHRPDCRPHARRALPHLFLRHDTRRARLTARGYPRTSAPAAFR